MVKQSTQKNNKINTAEVDERSTPQLPRTTCMQTPVTEREIKATEVGIPKSIDETFLMRKKRNFYNQK